VGDHQSAGEALDRREQIRLVRELVDEVPELRAVFDDHTRDGRELRPDEFLVEVALWTTADFARQTGWDQQATAWRDVLAFLEERCDQGPAGTRAFVKEWFLDHLPEVGMDHFEIRFMLHGALTEDRQALVDRLTTHLSTHDKPSEKALIDRLTEAVPEVAPVMREHVNVHGVVNSHMFFGDLTRWVVQDFAESGNKWRTVLEILEDEFERNYEKKSGELISVSFLENLPSPPEAHGEIAYELGPRMRTALERMRGPLPPRRSRILP
jgi:hypothetical protein